MARDPLAVLRRLRDAAVTEALRSLTAARAQERQGAQRLEEHRIHIRHEQSEAIGDEIEAFASWLPHARDHAHRLQASLEAEATHVARLQETLVVCRTEADAVVKAMQRQQAEASLILARKEQGLMDEAAGTVRFRR